MPENESKSDISDKLNYSTPAPGTSKRLKTNQIHSFFQSELKVCQQIVPQKEYNFARLVHHGYNMSKRWYVEFWAWNETTERKERVRLFKPLNYKKNTLSKRISIGEQMVMIVNAQLESGMVLGKKGDEGLVQTVNPSKLTLLSAIDYVALQKELNGHRKNYYRSFKTLHTMLSEWLDYRKQPDFSLKQFDKQDGTSFFEFLRDKKGLRNKTINGAINNLRTSFNFIERQSDKVFKKNPLEHIAALPEIAKMHAAYSDSQIDLIKKEINVRKQNPKVGHQYQQLELFISFIYYLLARPNELIELKVSDIHLDTNRVFISGSISKTKFDSYVEISPQLKSIIKKNGLLKYPGHYYIFSRSGVPGETRMSKNFFWEKHHDVLEKTGLLKTNPNFSLYSYKHSGVISLYKATKDIKLVQRQCRHQGIEQTNIYLRDLGLLSEYNQLKNWKGSI